MGAATGLVIAVPRPLATPGSRSSPTLVISLARAGHECTTTSDVTCIHLPCRPATHLRSSKSRPATFRVIHARSTRRCGDVFQMALHAGAADFMRSFRACPTLVIAHCSPVTLEEAALDASAGQRTQSRLTLPWHTCCRIHFCNGRTSSTTAAVSSSSQEDRVRKHIKRAPSHEPGRKRDRRRDKSEGV